LGTTKRKMDAVEFSRSIRQLALRAHCLSSDLALREEMIQLRGRFVDVLAAAPDGGRDVRRGIECAVEKLDVQTASSCTAKMTTRYWAVGGTRRAKRSQVRLVEA
jgi:hypothetical protein